MTRPENSNRDRKLTDLKICFFFRFIEPTLSESKLRLNRFMAENRKIEPELRPIFITDVQPLTVITQT